MAIFAIFTFFSLIHSASSSKNVGLSEWQRQTLSRLMSQKSILENKGHKTTNIIQELAEEPLLRFTDTKPTSIKKGIKKWVSSFKRRKDSNHARFNTIEPEKRATILINFIGSLIYENTDCNEVIKAMSIRVANIIKTEMIKESNVGADIDILRNLILSSQAEKKNKIAQYVSPYLGNSIQDLAMTDNMLFHNFDYSALKLIQQKLSSIKNFNLEIAQKTNLTSITSIYLGENAIMHIESGAFNGFNKTIRLRLNNNKLHGQLDSKAFEGLYSLTFLDLKDNNITGVITKEFNNLKNLKFIDLRNNNITENEQTRIKNELPNIKIIF